MTTDDNCEKDRVFTVDYLSSCKELFNVSEPVLYIRVEECVAGVYLKPEEDDELELCREKHLRAISPDECESMQDQLE